MAAEVGPSSLLPEVHRVPKLRWAQRRRFVVVVAEVPDNAAEVASGSAVHLMSEDGLSVAMVFRTAGDDEVFAASIHFFDAVHYGIVEGPAYHGQRRVRFGFMKQAPKEWPRLTKDRTPHAVLDTGYDWDLDEMYAEDEGSSSADGSEKDSQSGEEAEILECSGCGERTIQLHQKSQSHAATAGATDTVDEGTTGGGNGTVHAKQNDAAEAPKKPATANLPRFANQHLLMVAALALLIHWVWGSVVA